ncbi:UNVERIFIED_CONTAM: hypothetical protein K2H54_015798 [Gekko kuhli]
MPLLAQILQMGCRQVLRPKGTRISGVVFVRVFQQLPRLSGKASLEAQDKSAAAAAAQDKGEKEMVAELGDAGGLLQPGPHARLQRVKSLQEMPGPKFFSNLREFFWKDGFGRIHEIQRT